MGEFTETFWLGFIGAVIGFLGLSMKMLLKSKCQNIDFCGIKIQRDVRTELEEEKYEIDHNVDPDKIKF